MRFSRPSTGTILGAVAVFIALGGTAFAAGATVVNIADPTTPANIAHVNKTGQLQTAGSTSVTNTVNTELAAPSAYVDTFTAGVNSSQCTVIAAPPSGKALIVRDVNIDTFQTDGGDYVALYTGKNCSTPIGVTNPAAVGETTVPYDPGLAIPAGSALSADAEGSVLADVTVTGYTVPSSQVPASASSASRPGQAGTLQPQ